jgi:diguanylate cyclase (GGDEF)-like protein/PAS domain S-box-containing protein
MRVPSILTPRLGPLRGFSSYLVAASCVLVVGQAIGIATLGHRTRGPLVSNVIQLALGLICVLACTEAFRHSRGIARYAWRLLAVVFLAWVVAQTLSVYVDVSGDHSPDRLANILFFVSVIPFAMIAFLDPDGEPNHFDKLHILDFVQVCISWVAIFLYFSPSMWSPATAFRIGPLIWSRTISFDGLLVATFVVRALFTTSKAARSLFGRMAVFLTLSGIADSYALQSTRNLQPGGWFDLIWSALLAIPILIAATWKSTDESGSDASPRSHNVVVNQLFPLLYPLLSFIILARVDRAYPLLAPVVFTVGFSAFAARVLIIQHRQGQSQEALRQSETAYRLLFDSNPLPMWVFERKTLKFLAVNEAASRQYGFSSQEFLTMTIADIRPAEDIPALLEATATPSQGLQEAAAWRHRKKNGAIIDVEIVGHDLTFHGIDAELIAVRDVTDRKKAEETRRELAAIVEFSQDGIIGKNIDGVITSWNRAAEKMYGYTRDEVVGRDLSFLVPPERQAEIPAVMERILNGQSIENLETERLTKAGSVLDVSVSISPIKDASGHITGASAIARDITFRKRAEEQLKLQSAALEAAANAIVITDFRGTIQWVNPAFTTMTGYSAEEVLGKNPRLLKSGLQPQSYYANLWSTISSGRVWHGELVNRRKDGTTYVEEMTITPVIRDAQNPANRYFIAIKQDISERKQSEKARQQAEDKYRAIFEDAVIGIFQTTPDSRPLSVNRAFAKMHGYDSPEQYLAEVSNVARQLFVDPNRMVELRRELDASGIVHGAEAEVRQRDGTIKFMLVSVRAVRDAGGNCVHYEGTTEDITSHKLAENRVQYLAFYDDLTGLPNRTLLKDRLSKALAAARRQGDKVALLFLDLDRFKDINDSLGHSVGDLLLQEVAKRLKAWGREQDTVSRLAGDEFLITLTHVKDVADAAVAAERLMDTMTAEFVIEGHSLSVGCCLGISIFPEHGTDSETLIKNADAAMYVAKADGRSNFRFFTEEMNTQVVERLTLESSLRLALGKKELFLMYQPQMDIATGRITGLEALLRWQHPELGLVPPDKFIRIAENCGLILPIGEWVLRTACSQARKWQDEGIPSVTVAVNVSAVQFRQEGFCELVRKVLRETGLPPQYLELELTESLLLANADLMLSVIKELKAMGLTLAIDDFGTGYSSFSYLRQFHVSKLKIDRSFIRDVAANPDDAAITTAIISMARSLHLKVIAEGVEDEAQMSFLRAHQCDEIQGYYFSKPLAVDKIAEKLRGNSPKPQVRAQATGAQS